MLDSVKDEMIAIVFGDYMCQQEYGSLHYTSHSDYDSFTSLVHDAMENGEILDDEDINCMADATDWYQGCAGDVLSEEFIIEFAETIDWTALRKNQKVPLHLIIEYQNEINITYFVEQGWIQKSDLVRFKTFKPFDVKRLLKKGIFNKFDVLDV